MAATSGTRMMPVANSQPSRLPSSAISRAPAKESQQRAGTSIRCGCPCGGGKISTLAVDLYGKPLRSAGRSQHQSASRAFSAALADQQDRDGAGEAQHQDAGSRDGDEIY